MMRVQSIYLAAGERRSFIVGATASRVLLRVSASYTDVSQVSARRCSAASMPPDCDSFHDGDIDRNVSPLVADTVSIYVVCGLLAGPREQMPRLATNHYPRVAVDHR